MSNISKLTRREAFTAFAGAAWAADAAPSVESIRSRLPKDTPGGVAAILAGALRSAPGSHNTDWFGTLLVKGLIEWSERGIPEAGEFATRWLDFHLASKGLSPYSGSRSRAVNAGGVTITTYCGHFGLAFPCWEMVRQRGDERARRICLDVARIILHETARNRFGMVNHADKDDFAIPDTCYFVVTPLMIAYAADPANGAAYREQALYQLRTSTGIFLDRNNGLAKTILLKDGIGATYWTRATGWLLWSMTGVLRHLPPGDPDFEAIVRDLRLLADGISRAQDPSGALHLYVNEPASPLETTGTAMCAMGLHESIRRRWLPASFAPVSRKAWEYVKTKITPDGRITGAYTGWAVPAEQRVIEMDKIPMGWIPGFILSAAAELSGA
jgi:rhamnogalacturonyl hydrolase YesR